MCNEPYLLRFDAFGVHTLGSRFLYSRKDGDKHYTVPWATGVYECYLIDSTRNCFDYSRKHNFGQWLYLRRVGNVVDASALQAVCDV